jgi:hypothetical protein
MRENCFSLPVKRLLAGKLLKKNSRNLLFRTGLFQTKEGPVKGSGLKRQQLNVDFLAESAQRSVERIDLGCVVGLDDVLDGRTRHAHAPGKFRGRHVPVDEFVEKKELDLRGNGHFDEYLAFFGVARIGQLLSAFKRNAGFREEPFTGFIKRFFGGGAACDGFPPRKSRGRRRRTSFASV